MRLGLLMVLAGCNGVFGLTPTKLVDAGPAGGVDAVDPGCRFIADIAADTAAYLSDELMVGKNIELLTGPTHHALLAFAMDGVVMPGEHIAGAVLKLAPTTVCDPCDPCPAMTASRYQIYWNWDEWKESKVTQTYRDADTLDAWNKPGADLEGVAPVNADRSALLVDAPLPATNGQVLELHVPRAAIEQVGHAAEPWILPYASPPPAMRLSLQLRTDGMAAFASDDFDNNTCNMTLPLPTLTVTVCR